MMEFDFYLHLPMRLSQRNIVKVGEEILDAFHCQNYAPGHVVFVCPGTNPAIIGDVLFKGSIGPD